MKAEQSKFLESVNAEARDELDESGGPKEEGKDDYVDETIEHELVCSLCHAHSRSPLSIPVLLQVRTPEISILSFMGLVVVMCYRQHRCC